MSTNMSRPMFTAKHYDVIAGHYAKWFSENVSTGNNYLACVLEKLDEGDPFFHHMDYWVSVVSTHIDRVKMFERAFDDQCVTFMRDNERFDTDRFSKAAGVYAATTWRFEAENVLATLKQRKEMAWERRAAITSDKPFGIESK